MSTIIAITAVRFHSNINFGAFEGAVLDLQAAAQDVLEAARVATRAHGRMWAKARIQERAARAEECKLSKKEEKAAKRAANKAAPNKKGGKTAKIVRAALAAELSAIASRQREEAERLAAEKAASQKKVEREASTIKVAKEPTTKARSAALVGKELANQLANSQLVKAVVLAERDALKQRVEEAVAEKLDAMVKARIEAEQKLASELQRASEEAEAYRQRQAEKERLEKERMAAEKAAIEAEKARKEAERLATQKKMEEEAFQKAVEAELARRLPAALQAARVEAQLAAPTKGLWSGKQLDDLKACIERAARQLAVAKEQGDEGKVARKAALLATLKAQL